LDCYIDVLSHSSKCAEKWGAFPQKQARTATLLQLSDTLHLQAASVRSHLQRGTLSI